MNFLIFLVGLIGISGLRTTNEERCEGYSNALAYLSRCVMIGYNVDQTEQEILTTTRNHPELSCPCLNNIPDLFPTCSEKFEPNLDCDRYGVQQLIQISNRDRHDGKEDDHDKDKDKEDGHDDKDEGEESKGDRSKSDGSDESTHSSLTSSEIVLISVGGSHSSDSFFDQP
jgi:hypothetical protein